MMGAEDRFGWNSGEVSFEDDDGTLVRVGAVSEETRKILAKHGQEPKVMPELIDGVIHYPDGHTKALDSEEPAVDSTVRGRVRRFFHGQ